MDFSGLGLIVAIPIFLASAVAVWVAGTKLTRYANVISDRTGMGQAVVGLLLLGGVTSLPELAVALTSSLSGDASLAVNSILGGIAMQVAILAAADAMIGRKALTHIVPDPKVILQAGLKILVLSIVTAGIVVGDSAVLGIGIWMWLLIGMAGLALWVLSRVPGRQAWKVEDVEVSKEEEDGRAEREAAKDAGRGLKWALLRGSAAAAVILFAGYLLSRTGDTIAEQTGLGQSFFATVFLAIATSLPEMSTVTSAMRAGLYTMAVSDIFGTNIIDVSFLFFIDLTDGGGAVLNGTGAYEAFSSIMAIAVTAIFVAGLAERRNRTVFRMGYDSVAVLAVYLASLVVLYSLR